MNIRLTQLAKESNRNEIIAVTIFFAHSFLKRFDKIACVSLISSSLLISFGDKLKQIEYWLTQLRVNLFKLSNTHTCHRSIYIKSNNDVGN